jgi:hypothetical protein
VRGGNGGVVVMTDGRLVSMVMTTPHDQIVGGGGEGRGKIIEKVKEEEISRKEEELTVQR